MSRSNGPVTRGGGHRQDWQHTAEPDLSAHPVETPSHQPYQWPQLSPQQAQQAYSQTGSHQHDYSGHQSEPQSAEPQFHSYHYPHDSGGHQPFSTPVQHPPFFGEQPPQHAAAQGQYAPRFEHYLNAQQQNGAHYGHHEQPAAEPDHHAYAQRQSAYEDQGLSQLQPTGQPRRMHATLREQLEATQQSHWQQAQGTREHVRHGHEFRNHDPRAHDPRAHDPGAYDLGSYMPAEQQQGYDPAATPGLQDGRFDPHWQDPNGYAGQPGAHHSSAADYYAQLSSESLPVAGHEQIEPDLDEADEDDYEETGRGRRGLLIVAALAGAIVVGGGLAYGYKTIIGPSPKGAPPVIKADTRPAKSQPDDPGGKQFAHSDSKLMGRLEGDGASDRGSSGGARASTLDDADPSGVRRVSTVVVGRDGSIAPPAEPRLPPTTVSVPGMTIVDGFGGRGPIMPSRTEPQPQPAPAATPRIIAKATPPAEPAAAPAAQSMPPPTLRSAAIEPEREPEARQPAPRPPVTKAAATPPPAPKSSPVGYVAVLASQKSRIDALKTFADLQQKYIDVLQNKIPDVQEADLSARGLGTMYRVVVGPPSSREAASDLCVQLRSAGFQGCWVTAY